MNFLDQVLNYLLISSNLFTAPEGHIIRLDFREYFHIEKSEGCKFDYLEVRFLKPKFMIFFIHKYAQKIETSIKCPFD